MNVNGMASKAQPDSWRAATSDSLTTKVCLRCRLQVGASILESAPAEAQFVEQSPDCAWPPSNENPMRPDLGFVQLSHQFGLEGKNAWSTRTEWSFNWVAMAWGIVACVASGGWLRCIFFPATMLQVSSRIAVMCSRSMHAGRVLFLCSQWWKALTTSGPTNATWCCRSSSLSFCRDVTGNASMESTSRRR